MKTADGGLLFPIASLGSPLPAMARALLPSRVGRLLWRVARACVLRLPMNAGRALAGAIGTAMYCADTRGRRTVRSNLRGLIPPACGVALRRASRRAYASFAVAAAESLRLDALPSRMFHRDRLDVQDSAGVFAAGALQGPAILVTVHVNWDLLGAALHHLGFVREADVIIRPEREPWLASLRERLRARLGFRSLLLDRAPLAALRALHDRRILVIVGDRDYAGSGLVVPVAGRPLRLPLGPAALAVQTGAPIIPLFLARRGWRRFALMVAPPLRAIPERSKSDEVPRLTHALGHILGRFLLAAPAQWVAFHPVFADQRGAADAERGSAAWRGARGPG